MAEYIRRETLLSLYLVRSFSLILEYGNLKIYIREHFIIYIIIYIISILSIVIIITVIAILAKLLSVYSILNSGN